jgi:hypothetical protein
LIAGLRQNAGLRARDQLIVAAALGVATYFGILRIAEAKSETAVGGGVAPLDARRREELEAFQELRGRMTQMGDPALADRLERLREAREIWVAPRLGPERWAVFVEALSLVKRIYLRREALLDPVAHLYRTPRPDIPRAYQEAHAWFGLAGALRHELAHRDGVRDEAAAYDAELAWYETVRQAPPPARLSAEERRAWDWGLESAVLSARKARATASGASGTPSP